MLLITGQPLNQEFSDASVRRKEQMGVIIAGVPCFLSPIATFSLSPNPLPVSTPATQTAETA